METRLMPMPRYNLYDFSHPNYREESKLTIPYVATKGDDTQ